MQISKLQTIDAFTSVQRSEETKAEDSTEAEKSVLDVDKMKKVKNDTGKGTNLFLRL